MSETIMSATRKLLPQRRRAETCTLSHNGLRYFVTLGFYPDDTVGEMFVSAGRAGSDADTNARDAAILFSLARQYGCPIDEISRALTRDANGEPSGVVGAAVDRMVIRTNTLSPIK
jgi:hypothetical protein